MNNKFKMKNGEITDKAIYRFETGEYLEITIQDYGRYDYNVKVKEYNKNGELVEVGLYYKLGYVEERYDIMTDIQCITHEDNDTYVADIETYVDANGNDVII